MRPPGGRGDEGGGAAGPAPADAPSRRPQAALLHDTLEDTATSAGELEARFGGAVRALVEEVSDDKALPRAQRKQLQLQRAPARSPAARLLLLADKLHNLRDLHRCAPQGESGGGARARGVGGLGGGLPGAWR